jgi:hypothetical protein
MARGCARIDSRLDTAKIGSDGRVEVHRALLLAGFGGRKTFPHSLGQKATSGPGNATSVVPLEPDITDRAGHVGFVPIAHTAAETRTSSLRVHYRDARYGRAYGRPSEQ